MQSNDVITYNELERGRCENNKAMVGWDMKKKLRQLKHSTHFIGKGEFMGPGHLEYEGLAIQ